jgi:hypothetical protein
MRGVEKSTLEALGSHEILNPERAEQVDTSLRFAAPLARGELIYGLRYLNHASRFDARGTPVDGLLSDRNVGFMPLLGHRIRL